MLNDWTERLSATGGANDYHRLPLTDKQLAFAKSIAARSGLALPDSARSDRQSLSAWIETHKAAKATSKFADYPSSKQVRFAEALARRKRSEIPHECFRDRVRMSRWIDSQK